MLNPDRIAHLRSQMAAADLDCVALWPSANWRYLWQLRADRGRAAVPAAGDG